MTRIFLLALLGLTACTTYHPSLRYFTSPFYARDIAVLRLEGRWYEVASFPLAAQAGCRHTTADFNSLPDGRVALRISCRDTATGATRQIDGVATVAGPAELTLKQAGVPLATQLALLDVSRDGRMALIGVKGRTGGWMLHRSRAASPQDYDRAREIFGRSGYDVAALQRTNQR
ncbi:lipocalin family protein [Fertoebacter nigrum]|uniref:Outer membrane lipoprotein Blc n=1 Tax=Fertoeibacter niger TaxID=2656921 RepID=A0A8X8H059_9RHOB|nr:lipocalin family protein [Fertoeibacter niger]NUB45103.1 lipocalin family protein [Fertoeibacter niger]